MPSLEPSLVYRAMLALALLSILSYWSFVICSAVRSGDEERSRMRQWASAGILPTIFMIVPLWVFVVLGIGDGGLDLFKVDLASKVQGWHLWQGFFPLLVCSSAIAALFRFGALIVAITRPDQKPSLPFRFANLGLMVLVFLAIGSKFTYCE